MEEREKKGEKKNIHWRQTKPSSKTCRRAF